jgi:hypothetical protein
MPRGARFYLSPDGVRGCATDGAALATFFTRGSFPLYCMIFPAGVAELADATDSKSVSRKGVWVRPPPPALFLGITTGGGESLSRGLARRAEAKPTDMTVAA